MANFIYNFCKIFLKIAQILSKADTSDYFNSLIQDS